MTLHITELVDVEGQSLFKTVLSDSHHVLHRLYYPKQAVSRIRYAPDRSDICSFC